MAALHLCISALAACFEVIRNTDYPKVTPPYLHYSSSELKLSAFKAEPYACPSVKVHVA